jgi:hypothetical protein
VSLRLILAACSRRRAWERRRLRGVGGVACFLTESARSGGFHARQVEPVRRPAARNGSTTRLRSSASNSFPSWKGGRASCDVLVMLNRGTGQAAALTFWENEADLRCEREGCLPGPGGSRSERAARTRTHRGPLRGRSSEVAEAQQRSAIGSLAGRSRSPSRPAATASTISSARVHSSGSSLAARCCPGEWLVGIG